MNSALNVMFANQAESNELRELSHEEKIEVSGGLVCYKNPAGSSNSDRYEDADSSSAPGGSAYFAVWNGTRYNKVKLVDHKGTFRNWCYYTKGYKYIYSF